MKWLDNIIYKFFHGIFIALMIISVLLYKERLFADGAYYIFKIVNSGGLHVEHGRIVLGLSQILPCIGLFFGLPLKFIMVLSSLGHELFYYTIFLILLYLLKDKKAAIALVLIHVVGQLWLYYTPMYEICYGSALALLFYSLLASSNMKNDFAVFTMVIVLWFSLTSHLENTVLILFLILYNVIIEGKLRQKHWFSIGILAIGIVLKFLTLTEYEQYNLTHSFHDDATVLNLLKGSYLMKLGKLFVTYFPEVITFTLLSSLILLKNKAWKKAIIYFGAIGFLILIINRKANAIEFIRYFESMYHPVVVLAVFLFVFEMFSYLKSTYKSILLIAILILALGRIYWIYDFGKPLQLRSAQIEKLVDYSQSLSQSKFIIEKRNF